MDELITRTSRDEELAELRERVVDLENRLEDREQDHSAAHGDGDGPISRRRLLGLAGATAAGGVGAAMLGASPAGAADPNDVVLGVSGQDAGANQTGITSTSGTATFRADNTNPSAGGMLAPRRAASA
jgi:hypothetical protein